MKVEDTVNRPGNALHQTEALKQLQRAFESTNQDRAVKYCKEALEEDPTCMLAYYHMGLIYAAKMQWAEAVDSLNHALEIKPDDPSLYFNLGTICLNAGWFDDAEKYFLRAREIDPVCEGAHYYLATVHYRRGELEKAQALATRALTLRRTECTIKREHFESLLKQIESKLTVTV